MEFPDKSGGSKPSKKVEIITENAKKVERPATRRFVDSFIVESPRNLAGRIFVDIVIPRFKQGLYDSAMGMVSGLLWGDSSMQPPAGLQRGTILGGGQTVNYNAIGTTVSAMARQAVQPASRVGGSYSDLLMPTQGEAERILANLYALLNQYRMVAVADLYESVGISPEPSDESYGWTSLDSAKITRMQEGWVLQLPRPALIK